MSDWRENLKRAQAQTRNGLVVGRLHRPTPRREAEPAPSSPGQVVPVRQRPFGAEEFVGFRAGAPLELAGVQQYSEELAEDTRTTVSVASQNLIGLGLSAVAPGTEVLVINHLTGKQLTVTNANPFMLNRVEMPGRIVNLTFGLVSGRAMLSYTAALPYA